MEPKLVALQDTSVTPSPYLFVSLELCNKKWHASASDWGTRICEHTVEAGDGQALLGVVERARTRLHLGKDVPIVSCYEAGRDGFWLHRFLEAHGIRNHVIDSASIEVNRRQRRAKTDRLDGRKLLSMLVRFVGGEKKVWALLRVPTEAQEDERRPHRERARLVGERGQHVARIKSLLVLHNVRFKRIPGRSWIGRLKALTLPPRLQAELERETERLALVERQLAQLEREQAERLAPAHPQCEDSAVTKQRQLQQLRGLGKVGPWVLARELFGWRTFNNRRELAGSVGLGSSPYRSGSLEHDQGISKAGNGRVRTLMVELAWSWLRYQPGSALSKWYLERFGSGGRSRRIGIVALARRLLIALWRFVEHGVIPQGAKLKAA
jgi:transposase